MLFCLGFSLFFQTGLKINTSQAYIFGFVTDYFILAIHPAEILILALFLLQISKLHRLLARTNHINRRLAVFTATSLLVLFTSSYLAQYPWLAFFGLIKIFFFCLTIIAVWSTFANLSIKNFSNHLQILTTGLISGALISSVFGYLQFFYSASPDLPILGSYYFSSTTPNIALGSLLNAQFLRAYGNTPHPNVFAALLLITLVFSFYHFVRLKPRALKVVFAISQIMLVFSILITFSRLSIITLIFLLSLLATKNISLKPKIILLTSTGLLFWLILYLSGLNLQSKSITERIELDLIGLKVFADHLLFGVGPLNYLISAQGYFFQNFNLRLFQAPHNVFLLILAEYGLLGGAIAVFGITRLLKKVSQLPKTFRTDLVIPLLVVVFIGLTFDHYYYSLFQTNLLLGLIIGLTLAPSKNARL